mmetsp:Transcript_33937/g.46553  ORF Transcript_33937/g.46553 Transcript_33937/m.46553 type:complete len:236 (-) Transcript_33937:403-1110(-)
MKPLLLTDIHQRVINQNVNLVQTESRLLQVTILKIGKLPKRWQLMPLTVAVQQRWELQLIPLQEYVILRIISSKTAGRPSTPSCSMKSTFKIAACLLDTTSTTASTPSNLLSAPLPPTPRPFLRRHYPHKSKTPPYHLHTALTLTVETTRGLVGVVRPCPSTRSTWPMCSKSTSSARSRTTPAHHLRRIRTACSRCLSRRMNKLMRSHIVSSSETATTTATCTTAATRRRTGGRT